MLPTTCYFHCAGVRLRESVAYRKSQFVCKQRRHCVSNLGKLLHFVSAELERIRKAL